MYADSLTDVNNHVHLPQSLIFIACWGQCCLQGRLDSKVLTMTKQLDKQCLTKLQLKTISKGSWLASKLLFRMDFSELLVACD